MNYGHRTITIACIRHLTPSRLLPEKSSAPPAMKATVSNHDKDIMRMRATRAASEEMGVRL